MVHAAHPVPAEAQPHRLIPRGSSGPKPGGKPPCQPGSRPIISVIIINYNGAPWLERCLDSIQRQTVFGEIEIIVADNASPDGSELIAARIMRDWQNGSTLQNGENLGYSEGNNRAAQHARGQYLFFLNNDTWLEPDCLERLLADTRAAGAGAAAPIVQDYLGGVVQTVGSPGFDPFGLLSGSAVGKSRSEPFVADGCSLFIDAAWFHRLGGFDSTFFMYADEYDLCWRLWIAGSKIVLSRSAILHHRGAAAVNPRGGTVVLEARTSDTKRFFANRNNLLVLMKNSQHLLLALVPLQLLLLGGEAVLMWGLTRRWSHVRRAYLDPLADCWRLRGHILAERRRIRSLRRRGDLWMLRFLRLSLNRSRELRRFRRLGLPKVDPK